MNGHKLFDNKILFILYGILNTLLLLILITILILFFNDIFLINRTVFVLFVGIHLFLLFFVKVHYLNVHYHEQKQIIEFHYNRKFGINWNKKARTVLLPLKQFDGYQIEKDALGLHIITFFKLENKERFELGPFHIGLLSKSIKKGFENSFGESL